LTPPENLRSSRTARGAATEQRKLNPGNEDNMKHLRYTSAALLTVAMAASIPAESQTPVAYSIRDLGPVGESPGQPVQISREGFIAGDVVANNVAQATLWYQKIKVHLGGRGLGGANSVAFSVNDSLQVVGEAETATPDPNHEDFCGFRASGLTASGICLPFLWQDGRMIALPTLGGPNGVANQINDAGEVVGQAENSTPDYACPLPQVLQFKPTLWKNGKVQKLQTVGGDPDGVALAINRYGQAVGGSGLCTSYQLTTLINLFSLHALLWEKGKVTDLGSLGGTGYGGGNLALALNDLGQVVGNADLPGDVANHAFLWTKGKPMQDLGTLSGDAISAGLGINNSGRVVGVSLDANFNPRAFVWQNGVMTDLNTLIPTNSTLYLLLACSINSEGQIVGFAVDTLSGETHGYIATPKWK
jgi:probable HAF family extracellular repeat protein